MHGLAILMMLLTFLVGAAAVVFWVWTLIDCLTNKRLTEGQKAIWAVVIILVGTIGSLIYFFAGRSPKVYAPPQQYYYQPQVYRQPQAEQVPVEQYYSYQDGYRAQSEFQPDLPNATMLAQEERSAPPQVQYEHIQISYPE
jgi:hypothetical protein